MNGIVYTLAFDEDGNLWAGGAFTTAGGLSTGRVAIWNGSTWTHGVVSLPAVNVRAILPYQNNVYIGHDGTGTAVYSFETTVTNNGKATSYPVIKIKRSGGTGATLAYLHNETTGTTLWLDYNLLDGETVTIDLRPRKRSIKSNFYRSVWRALLRNSKFSKFRLQAGSNVISVFVNPAGSPTVTTTMEWRLTDSSVDGVA
jgi:hypothetical protein